MSAEQQNPSARDQPRRHPAAIDPEPVPASAAYDAHIDNSNSNSSILSGTGNIVNNNPNLNLLSSPGAVVNLSQVTNINVPYPATSNVTLANITTALKERHVPQASYDAQPGKGCMSGTRLKILRDIENWILSPEGQRIFWLTGMAGTGKTAIAHTVCLLARDHANTMLGGSFFCSRSTGIVSQRDVRCVIPTLAQLLARQSVEFSKVLADELARDPDILHKRITEQVEHLLNTPLRALKDSSVQIVFVIDALDECRSQSATDEDSSEVATHRIISEMLEALVDFSRGAVKLPVKFLVTSRPETHIRDTPISDGTFSTVLYLHAVNKQHVTADILLYVSARLSSSPKLRARFTDRDAEILAELCDGLFIVATTALQYFLGKSIDAAASRFKTLLNSTGDGLSRAAAAPLDRMYHLILADAARVDEFDGDGDELRTMQKLLGSLLYARMALSVSMLADLLIMDKDDVRATLAGLHAVVNVPEDDDEPSLRTLHASFGDYLLGRAPSDLRISSSLGHEMLASSSLHLMAERLHFNVSQCRSSYEPNPTFRPDSIAQSLEYACFQWAYHVAAIPEPSDYDARINLVFRPRFLFWLEVASVLDQVWHAAAMLFVAASTVLLQDLSRFLRDAHTFVISSHEAISWSAPHIYLSALPCAAKRSFVYHEFEPLCTGLISVANVGVRQHGGGLIMILAGHKSGVTSVSYSPDGRLLGSGSYDDTVRIWDTRLCQETMSPLRSNDGPVLSVAFAPNSKKIAAGTDAGDVCIWSLLSGRASLQRLTGHLQKVTSVTFAPADALIASASDDRTVRIWDLESGHQLAMLKGLTGPVTEVVFSPDGTILACPSRRDKIGLWNIHVGDIPGQQLGGDESRIVSGEVFLAVLGDQSSSDTSEEALPDLLDVSDSSNESEDGSSDSHVSASPALNPLDELDGSQWTFNGLRTFLQHDSDMVVSICFSPDGTQLVSGSTSGIYLHDVRNDRFSSRLFCSSAKVQCVRFSPDGRTLVSASADRSVCIWTIPQDASKSTPMVLNGHTDCVHSVSFSPDGLHLASASNDRTIRIWDASGDQQVVPPLSVHEYRVGSSEDTSTPWGCQGWSALFWDSRLCEARRVSLLGHNEVINSVTISLDGRLLASASEDHTVRIWDAQTGDPVSSFLTGHVAAVRTVSFSLDARLLASGSTDCTVRMWDVATGEMCHSGPLRCAGHVHTVSFSRNERLIAAGDDVGSIRLWHVRTGRLTRKLLLQDDWTSFSYFGFSPDGTRILSCSRSGPTRVWDVSTGKELLLIDNRSHQAEAASYSSDGQLIWTNSTICGITAWSASTGAKVLSLRGHVESAQSVTFTPDGRFAVSSSGKEAIRVWDLEAMDSVLVQRSFDSAATLVVAALVNGWLVGASGERLLWVPAEYRAYLQLPRWWIQGGQCRITVAIGNEGWHHGENWMSCWRQKPSVPTARSM